MEEAKKKAIDEALKQIEKLFGKGAVMRMGDSEVGVFKDVISTGSLTLDSALGIGGIPRGRITEIYGPEASGKTTLGLHILAEAQKSGGVGAFIDVEHALDPFYAKNLGVDTDNLLVSQPGTAEEALEIAETLVRSGAIDVVIIDSVAALVPRAEIEGEMGDSHMGLQARLMSQAMRKLTGAVSKTKVAIIFMNQIRHKIGVMFGDPTTTPGGLALKFYTSVRLNIRSATQIKKDDHPIGNHIKVKVAKNKLAPPFKEAELDIIYGKGISKGGELVDLGVIHNVIEKSGAWFSYKGEKIGQGRDGAISYLAQHPEISSTLEGEIRTLIGLG
ncbi:MAG: recombinase RecA [Candidatus Stahlbacteria bacterium]|nr:recombinase RecA [Candidatus Stahlbacteria bacterium]